MPKSAPRPRLPRGRRKLLAIGTLASISLAAAGWTSAGPIGKALAPCSVWTVVPTPVLEGAYLEAVDATATDDVWAVGEYGGTYGIVDHWNGYSWAMTTQQGISNSLSAVAAVSRSDVWASGYKLNRSGVTKAFAEHWDGTAWTPTSTPRPGYDSRLFALAAVSSTDVWGAGYYFQANLLHPLYVHWDGATWTQVPSPSSGGTIVYALAAVSPNDVWALGIQAAPQPFSTLPFAEHWDGASWTPARPARIPGGGNRQFLGGAAVASNDIWAVGYGEHFGPRGTPGTAIEHWDGSEWRLARAPNRGNMTDASVVSATDVWVVGGYSYRGNSRATSEHWDGSGWSALPTPNPGRNSILNGVMAINSADVWAVGDNLDQEGALVPLTMHSFGIC